MHRFLSSQVLLTSSELSRSAAHLKVFVQIRCEETDKVAVKSGGEDTLGWQGDWEAGAIGQATELIPQPLKVAVPATTQAQCYKCSLSEAQTSRYCITSARSHSSTMSS